MSVPKKLINYLEREQTVYELVSHRKVFTSWDLALTLHISPLQIAKSVVVKAKGKAPFIVLLSAKRNLDMKKLSNILFNIVQKAQKSSGPSPFPQEWGFPPRELKGKSYKIEFAKEKWIKEKLLGKMGATPPFGRLLKIPVIIDKPLLKEKELYVNSGDYHTAIKMRTKEFTKLEQPLSGNFSVKK